MKHTAISISHYAEIAKQFTVQGDQESLLTVLLVIQYYNTSSGETAYNRIKHLIS